MPDVPERAQWLKSWYENVHSHTCVPRGAQRENDPASLEPEEQVCETEVLYPPPLPSGSGVSATGSAVMGKLWTMNLRVVAAPFDMVGH